jgi:hypothetical protein
MAVYSPNGDFTFQRNRICGVVLGLYPGWVLEDVSNPIQAILDLGGGLWQRIAFKFRDNFWQPTSNAYNLSYVVEDAYTWYSFDMTHIHFVANVSFFTFADHHERKWIECDAGSPSVFLSVILDPDTSSAYYSLPPCS